MNRKIIITGILRDEDLFLVVKRKSKDELYPGTWEFPGGHLEDSETIGDALKRELREEIGFNQKFDAKIEGFTDELKDNYDAKLYVVELDFVIDVNKNDFAVTLSDEHSEYRWVAKDFEELSDKLKNKLKDI